MKALAYSILAALTAGLLLTGNTTVEASSLQRGRQRQQPTGGTARSAQAETSGALTLSPKMLDEYFSLGDYNSNGSISFREAREALAISRAGFARYDVDRDGLISSKEFADRYTAAVISGIELPQPIIDSGKSEQPVRTAVQLRLAFDINADRQLNAKEIQNLLTAYGKIDLDNRRILEQLDLDKSGALDLAELNGLVPLIFVRRTLDAIARPTGRAPREPSEPAPEIRTTTDLFGRQEVRESSSSASSLPPQLVGPIDHFVRLDSNQDGVISTEDLDALLRPVRCSIRLKAVIATLDTNEDGVLGRDEFFASME